MKKMIALLLALAALLGCTACGQKEEAPTVELDVTEMRAICELSTMDCYYHNVAKYFEKDAQKGFLGIGKKDKRFWMEYRVPSRIMRKFICRLRLNEVSRQ